MLHSNSLKNHRIENFVYANAAARTGAAGLVSADIGKIAFQSDNKTYWRLTATTPTWIALVGVPVGGTTGQVLGKASGTDFDASWRSSGVPVGGTTDQVLGKASGADYDATWRTSAGLPVGGDTNDILVKNSATDGDADWAPVPEQYVAAEQNVLFSSTDQTGATEETHIFANISSSIVGNDPGIAGIRIRIWGTIDNNTTAITFTPKIRYHNSLFTPASGTLLLTGPPIVGTTTALTGKAWDAEVDIYFTNFGASAACRSAMRVTDHTANSSGLPTTDCANSGTSDVAFNNSSSGYIIFTWTMSATTGTPHVRSMGAKVESIPQTP